MQTGGFYRGDQDLETVKGIYMKYAIDPSTIIINNKKITQQYKKTIGLTIHPDKEGEGEDFTYVYEDFPKYALKHYMNGQPQLTVSDVLEMTQTKTSRTKSSRASSSKSSPKLEKSLEDLQENIINMFLKDNDFAMKVIKLFMSLIVFVTLTILSDEKTRDIVTIDGIVFLLETHNILANLTDILKRSSSSTRKRISTKKRSSGGSRKKRTRKIMKRQRGGAMLFRAIDDYESDIDDYISFKTDDLIEVKDMTGDIWTGTVKGTKQTGKFPKEYVINEDASSKWGYGYDPKYNAIPGTVRKFIDKLIESEDTHKDTKEFKNLLTKYYSGKIIDKESILAALTWDENALNLLEKELTTKKEKINIKTDEQINKMIDGIMDHLNDINARNIVSEETMNKSRRKAKERLNTALRNYVSDKAALWQDKTLEWKRTERVVIAEQYEKYEIATHRNDSMKYLMMGFASSLSLYGQFLYKNDPLASSGKWTLNEDMAANLWPLVQYAIMTTGIISGISRIPALNSKFMVVVPLLLVAASGLTVPYYRANCAVGNTDYCVKPDPNIAIDYYPYQGSKSGDYWSSWVPSFPTTEDYMHAGPNLVFLLWNTIFVTVAEYIKTFIVGSGGDNFVFMMCSVVLGLSVWRFGTSGTSYFKNKSEMKAKINEIMINTAGFAMPKVDKDFIENGPPGAQISKARKEALETFFNTATNIASSQKSDLNIIMAAQTLSMRNTANEINREANKIRATGLSEKQREVLTNDAIEVDESLLGGKKRKIRKL